MGASGLGSRAIIGEFYNKLAIDPGMAWINDISMQFDSNQESETYKWLGMSPVMREWIGGRNAKGFRENGITIVNKTYEATMEVLVDEIRRDKTKQVMLRVAELASRTNSHWAKLLTALLVAGEAAGGECYDGQYFFDTDHSEGDSGTQDNDLTGAAATTTIPTAAEAEVAIMACVAAILGFKDDQGEPMNEDASAFRLVIPVTYLGPFASVMGNDYIAAGQSNTIKNLDGFKFSLSVNPRLTSSAKFYCFRADGQTKPLIRQEEEAVSVSAIAEGSELEFKENKHQYGVKAIRNVGYGYWQHACLYTFT
ncbi:Mu-like prophage major head subunit gpT family protein [Candidatus Pacearchaeota archaeon]|jgi:phage major head subunit gpT-like protein|nr:Mu-like prophage major head subunit gpT family protein [Candidatus Pacearchaeota archaeon]